MPANSFSKLPWNDRKMAIPKKTGKLGFAIEVPALEYPLSMCEIRIYIYTDPQIDETLTRSKLHCDRSVRFVTYGSNQEGKTPLLGVEFVLIPSETSAHVIRKRLYCMHRSRYTFHDFPECNWCDINIPHDYHYDFTIIYHACYTYKHAQTECTSTNTQNPRLIHVAQHHQRKLITLESVPVSSKLLI